MTLTQYRQVAILRSYLSNKILYVAFRIRLSRIFMNGNQISPTTAICTNCKSDPIIEFVAKNPLMKIGTVNGTETPVVIGTIPEAIAK